MQEATNSKMWGVTGQVRRAGNVPAQEIALDSVSAFLFHLVIVLHPALQHPD
jgi:hypothetical protein